MFFLKRLEVGFKLLKWKSDSSFPCLLPSFRALKTFEFLCTERKSPSCRLKKIQEKKKIIKEKSEKDLERRRAAGEVMEPANLLAEEKDEDLLFE